MATVIHRDYREITEDRECGACAACCTHLGVEELKKGSHMKCQFLTGTGNHKCSIYATRPRSCAEYHCAWREGWGPEWAKPNVSGILITLYPVQEDSISDAAATIIVFDESKTPKYRLTKLVANMLMLELGEVRVIYPERKKATLYKNGNIYDCNLLPSEKYEELCFEAFDDPIGRYNMD